LAQIPKKILLVDDEEAVLEVLWDILSIGGYGLACASDGAQGLEKFKSYRPSLVITDLKMPVMSGEEMIDAIREIDAEVAVFVASGTLSARKREQLAAVGVSHVFEKPFRVAELMDATLEILGQ
jgi:two-component system response regulator ArlR